MAKLFDDSLGNLEYLLLGLTFLGVLYLVMKQANIKLNLSQEGFNTSAHAARYANTVSDSTTHRGHNNR